MVWDKAPVALEPYQRWAIVDPNWTAAGGGIGFRNFFLDMPSGTQTGDLFCAGHAWMRDGRLFVAGGTAIYNVAGGGWYGAALVYQFAPDEYDASNQDYGVWHRQPDMGVTRWYPTVTVLGDDSFLITGGTDDGVVHNDYEVYRLQGAWGESPPTPTVFDQRTNGAGNIAFRTTDGFMVDASPPICGAVYDGAAYDKQFIGPSVGNEVQVSWHSFSDLASGIAQYAVAVVPVAIAADKSSDRLQAPPLDLPPDLANQLT